MQREQKSKTASLWLILCCCLAADAMSAQTRLLRIDSLPCPAGLRPTGFVQALDDSTVVVAANGGLYSFHDGGGWWLRPDSTNVLLSYFGEVKKERSFLAVHERPTNSTSLFWRFRGDSIFQNQRIGTLRGGAFRLLFEGNALFAFGFEKDTFRLFSYDGDTLLPIFSSHEYIPTDLRVLNANTVLMAFGRSFVALNRSEGLKELGSLPVPILSFGIRQQSNELWVSTADGLGVFDGGELRIVEPDCRGAVFISDEKMYVLDLAAHRVDVFRFSQ